MCWYRSYRKIQQWDAPAEQSTLGQQPYVVYELCNTSHSKGTPWETNENYFVFVAWPVEADKTVSCPDRSWKSWNSMSNFLSAVSKWKTYLCPMQHHGRWSIDSYLYRRRVGSARLGCKFALSIYPRRRYIGRSSPHWSMADPLQNPDSLCHRSRLLGVYLDRGQVPRMLSSVWEVPFWDYYR